jgi:hypothetical protein
MDYQIIIGSIVGQLTVVGLLFRWLHVQVRDNKQSVERLVLAIYTKRETNQAIELRLKPVEVGIAHVQDDIKEVKTLLLKLLDEKNK